jgi:hypothetical protein
LSPRLASVVSSKEPSKDKKEPRRITIDLKGGRKKSPVLKEAKEALFYHPNTGISHKYEESRSKVLKLSVTLPSKESSMNRSKSQKDHLLN